MADGTPQRIPPTSVEPTKPITQGEEQQPKPGEGFKSFMQEGSGPQGPGKAGTSPFDLAGQGAMQTAGPSQDTIASQMKSASSVLGDLQKQLHTKNLNLKHSQKYLLRNKLNSANQNIRAAATKMGVDVGPPPSTSSRQTPISKFLSILSDGQNQLNNAQGMLANLKEGDKPINPGDLLMIQVKLAKAQQELEYSSILLSKAVDDIKTMFGIQL